jgi:hypothetical protein
MPEEQAAPLSADIQQGLLLTRHFSDKTDIGQLLVQCPIVLYLCMTFQQSFFKSNPGFEISSYLHIIWCLLTRENVFYFLSKFHSFYFVASLISLVFQRILR